MAKATKEEAVEAKIKAKFAKWDKGSGNDGLNAVWGLGFVGALVYYIQLASNFTDGLLGILKALVWPATVVYKFLEGFYGVAS